MSHDNGIHLWHRLLGHRHPLSIKELENGGLTNDTDMMSYQTNMKYTHVVRKQKLCVPHSLKAVKAYSTDKCKVTFVAL